MRYFLDTEFAENGSTIDLISIGVLAEDGREFYACSTEARLDLVNDWVRSNVLPQLPRYGDQAWMSRKAIRDELELFIADGWDAVYDQRTSMGTLADLKKGYYRRDVNPQFWAYFADYDWVVLCQLFGTMMDLPAHFPRYCMDLKQWATQLGLSKDNVLSGWPKQEMGEHNALFDARWNAELYAYLSASAGKK
jgi:hypothetical protein